MCKSQLINCTTDHPIYRVVEEERGCHACAAPRDVLLVGTMDYGVLLEKVLPATALHPITFSLLSHIPAVLPTV